MAYYLVDRYLPWVGLEANMDKAWLVSVEGIEVTILAFQNEFWNKSEPIASEWDVSLSRGLVSSDRSFGYKISKEEATLILFEAE